MRKRLITISLILLLDGCASRPTPIERAQANCHQFGDSSASCLERQFNIEQAREDEITRESNAVMRAAINSDGPPSSQGALVGIPIVPLPVTNNSPTTPETNYERMNRQIKENCDAARAAGMKANDTSTLSGSSGCAIYR